MILIAVAGPEVWQRMILAGGGMGDEDELRALEAVPSMLVAGAGGVLDILRSASTAACQ